MARHLDMPKMDQSWHGGRCNPFSAFQAGPAGAVAMVFSCFFEVPTQLSDESWSER